MTTIDELIEYLNTHDRTLVVMCAVPCSGKSTLTNYILDNVSNDIEVLSTDNILNEIAISENSTYKEVWSDNIVSADKLYKKQSLEIAKTGKNAISDRMNVTAKVRWNLIAKFHKYTKIAVYIKTPEIDVLVDRYLSRNQEEGTKVHMSTIIDIIRDLTIPDVNEGFDYVLIVDN